MTRALIPVALIPVALLAGCSRALPPAPPPTCPAAVLSAEAPRHGVPIEDTPAGHCLARRAEAGDIAAALQLGDFYRTLPGLLPLIDRPGHELRWYRLAGDHGSPLGAWRAGVLIDTDPDIQIPNDALAYFVTAMKGQIPEAGPYLIDQWDQGRIDPGKIWKLRRWLDSTQALPPDQRAEMIAGFDKPPSDPLEEE